MDQFTRRLVGFAAQCGALTGTDVCRLFNAAIYGQGVPRHLSTDHDSLFEAHRWTANLRLLQIDEIKTVPNVPMSHAFVERLIGTMRREFLDHVLFWNARDLERKFADFEAYYNSARCHGSLVGDTPRSCGSGDTVPPCRSTACALDLSLQGPRLASRRRLTTSHSVLGRGTGPHGKGSRWSIRSRRHAPLGATATCHPSALRTRPDLGRESSRLAHGP
jgi:hypothetical protein